jgi:hypothetical protein
MATKLSEQELREFEQIRQQIMTMMAHLPNDEARERFLRCLREQVGLEGAKH